MNNTFQTICLFYFHLNNTQFCAEEFCHANAVQDENINIVDIVLIVGYILYDE